MLNKMTTSDFIIFIFFLNQSISLWQGGFYVLPVAHIIVFSEIFNIFKVTGFKSSYPYFN